MIKSLCFICSSRGEETKIMLASLKKRLIRLTHQYVPDFREEAQSTSKGQSGFHRLFSIMFGEENTSQLQAKKCSHDKFSRYLRRKLKYDNQTFNDLCNELVEKLSQRNYQLEILSMQIKNLSQACLRLSEMPENFSLIQRQMEKKSKVSELGNTQRTILTGFETAINIQQLRQQQIFPQPFQPAPLFQYSLSNIANSFHFQPNIAYQSLGNLIQQQPHPSENN